MLCAEVSAARAEADPADAVVTLRRRGQAPEPQRGGGVGRATCILLV